MSDVFDLDLPDTPAGRAIEQVVRGLSDKSEPGQLSSVRRLARVALEAMVRLIEPDLTSRFFIGLSRDALRMRGCGKGAKRG